MKVTIVVEKIANYEGKFLGYKAHFGGRAELSVLTKFKNQSVYELVRDFGDIVGVGYQEI
jgi:hypothetical protein